jgi:hypothetical protein
MGPFCGGDDGPAHACIMLLLCISIKNTTHGISLLSNPCAEPARRARTHMTMNDDRNTIAKIPTGTQHLRVGHHKLIRWNYRVQLHQRRAPNMNLPGLRARQDSMKQWLPPKKSEIKGKFALKVQSDNGVPRRRS